MGRPRRWDNAKELQGKIDGYFAQWEGLEPEDPRHKLAPNIWGLCLYADMSYDCFCDTENGIHDEADADFSEACKKAKLKLLEFNANHALTHTAGVVFNTVNLTRKMEEPWVNAQRSEMTGPGGGKIQVEGFSLKFVDPKPDAAG